MSASAVDVPSPPPTTAVLTGGSGGAARDLTRSDARLLARAVRQGWEIPEQMFRALPLEMAAIVTKRDQKDPQQHVYDPKLRIAAARVLVLMYGQTQKEDPVPQTHLHEHRHTVDLEVRRQHLLARLDQPGDG